MTSNLIDAAINETQATIHDLERQLRQQKKALKSLLKARAAKTGQDFTVTGMENKPPPLPDLVEKLLRERGSMHVSAVVKALDEQGVETNKQTLSSMFVRYIAKGERFQRTGPNTFGVSKRK